MNIIKTKNFALRLHPAGLAMLGLMAAAGHGRAALAALLALLLHEGFHLLALWLLKAPLRQLELTPFGGVMDVESFQSLRDPAGGHRGGRGPGSLLVGPLPRLPGEGDILRSGARQPRLGLFNALPACPWMGDRRWRL